MRPLWWAPLCTGKSKNEWDSRARTNATSRVTGNKGGFYHDGRFATLADVVEHYDGHLDLNLSAEQKKDLIEYLKSI
jgi:cytochrome c peroxidase